jgi:hypothetical protein
MMEQAWVQLYVQTQLESLCRDLGAQVGTVERETHDYMLQIVENLTKTLDAQGKSLDALNRKVRSLETKLTRKAESASEQDRPANGGGNLTVIGGRAS